MKHLLYIVLFVFVTSLAVGEEDAPAPRLTNGRKIQGTVVTAEEKGLAIQTARGKKVYPWRALSVGTRYRYEPGFSDKFDALMKTK